MGSGRIARDGGSADALAGNPQRNLAERLFDRVSPGGNGRTISPARVGMASDVLDRRAARATRAVYPDESAGIGSVEAAPRCEHGTGSADRRRRVEALPLSCRAHDVHDVPLARNAGPLP